MPLSILKLPVFLENEQRGKYKVSLHPGDYGGDLIIKFNMTYDKDPEIAKWFHNRDFRRALAMAINRDQLNEMFWLGTSAPRSVVPVETIRTSQVPSTARCGPPMTRSRPTPCWMPSGWTRRTPRATACAAMARAACA